MTVLDYEKLYNSYYLQVYSYVMTIVKSRSVAEEVTQNTFFKAMTARRSYEGKASELTWLCSIAKNLAIDECRKNSKFAELDEDTPETSEGMADTVEDKVEDQDTALRIHLVLHELQEPYKEVFQLRVFGELPFSQIGMIFGKSENWARVTYHRARLKIKERISCRISCHYIMTTPAVLPAVKWWKHIWQNVRNADVHTRI